MEPIHRKENLKVVTTISLSAAIYLESLIPQAPLHTFTCNKTKTDQEEDKETSNLTAAV